MEAAVIAALSDYFRRELISGSRGRVGVGVKTKKRSKPTTTDDPDDLYLTILCCVRGVTILAVYKTVYENALKIALNGRCRKHFKIKLA